MALTGCWSSNQQKDLGYINQTRRSNARGSLSADTAAMRKAQAWSEHMARTGRLEHTGGGSRLDTSGLGNWCGVAENVGTGPSTLGIHNAFLRSSAHRANMLGNYHRAGTGVVRRGTVVWVTEIYVRSC